MRVTRVMDHPQSQQDSQAAAAGATIAVMQIPSDFKREKLVMIFENGKRYGGGDIETMDFVFGSGTARITFKDPAGLSLLHQF